MTRNVWWVIASLLFVACSNGEGTQVTGVHAFAEPAPKVIPQAPPSKPALKPTPKPATPVACPTGTASSPETAPGQCLPVAPTPQYAPIDNELNAPYPDAIGNCPARYATTPTVKWCVRIS